MAEYLTSRQAAYFDGLNIHRNLISNLFLFLHIRYVSLDPLLSCSSFRFFLLLLPQSQAFITPPRPIDICHSISDALCWADSSPFQVGTDVELGLFVVASASNNLKFAHSFEVSEVLVIGQDVYLAFF